MMHNYHPCYVYGEQSPYMGDTHKVDVITNRVIV
jgi:hypothetical protein